MTTKTSSSISRRALLKALGAGAASLPFFKLLENSAVEAATDSPPLRFLAIYVPDGHAYEYFRPRAPGSSVPGSGGETDFTLDFDQSVMAPLQPFKDKLLIIDALDFECAVEDLGWGHNAVGSILTGTPNKRDTVNRHGPSLDVYLSSRVGSTAVPRLNACVGSNWGWHIMNTYIFADNGTWLPEIGNPNLSYEKLFGDFTPPSSEPDPNLVARLHRQRSKLDFIVADLKRMKSRLGATEAKKLDFHLEAVRAIERRLEQVSYASAGCTKPPAPNLKRDHLIYEPDFPPAPQDLDLFWELQADIIAQGFACDRTRIATLRIGSSEGMSLPFLGKEFDLDTHNAYQHNSGSYRETWPWNDISKAMATMQRYYYGRVAYMLNALDQIPEGDGTVLDNTIVMIATEMGNPARHDSVDIIFTLAGGGGKFRMGRYLNLKPQGGTIAHNKLLVSILHAFGIDQDTFGWDGAVGPLSGLT